LRFNAIIVSNEPLYFVGAAVATGSTTAGQEISTLAVVAVLGSAEGTAGTGGVHHTVARKCAALAVATVPPSSAMNTDCIVVLAGLKPNRGDVGLGTLVVAIAVARKSETTEVARLAAVVC
jgi:hypothetical protein